jgi:hypothetical protein
LIFHPFADNASLRVQYGDWLFRFCASISWRSLHHLLAQSSSPPKHLNEKQRHAAAQALDVWREYLLGQRVHPGRYEQHLVAFDAIRGPVGRGLPPNLNRYLLRAEELDLAASSTSAFVYSKMGRFAVFGFIDVEQPKHWRGSRVKVSQGAFSPTTYELPEALWRYLVDRMHAAWRQMDSLSRLQSQRVETDFIRDVDRYVGSDFVRAMELDVELFGGEAFKRRPPHLD